PMDPRPQLSIGQARGQAMDGDHRTGVQHWTVCAFVVGVIENDLAALHHELAAERDLLPGGDADARDAVAKPDRVGCAGGVAYVRMELLEPAAEIFDLQARERALHRGLLLG